MIELTRRRLLNLVGKAGGAAAAYRTMAAMGLLPVPAAYAGPPELPPGSGNGIDIVIIGAGIAGMVAAMELGRAGYRCRILEARSRAGGRNWTLRSGDVVEETGSRQSVDWDAGPHLYFNPGPGRIPYHHQGILSYCRSLGVAVEPLVNDNRGAYFQDDKVFDGKPVVLRRAINDARGFVAELAAKAIDGAALDANVSTEDKERIRGFVRGFGALGKDFRYHGTSRTGFAEAPGGGEQEGRRNDPIDIRQIIQSEFWWRLNFGEGAEMAATMMQPVGGMGRIGEAFGKALGDVITYNAEVTQLRRLEDAAQIVWRDRVSGAEHAEKATFVICAVPIPVLQKIDADFAPEARTAMAAADYVPAGKVAFQADRRFWEIDSQIYGGISWTSRDITQVWYPSAGFQEQKGIIVGAYIWSDDIGNAFAAKPPAQRLADAIADAEGLHPGYAKEVKSGVAVAWSKIPFTGGAWAEWEDDARATAYKVLLQPDGPFYFAGEHMSYITGWQEGAVRSAQYTIGEIAKRVAAKKL
jgi:monoamine oxidase